MRLNGGLKTGPAREGNHRLATRSSHDPMKLPSTRSFILSVWEKVNEIVVKSHPQLRLQMELELPQADAAYCGKAAENRIALECGVTWNWLVISEPEPQRPERSFRPQPTGRPNGCPYVWRWVGFGCRGDRQVAPALSNLLSVSSQTRWEQPELKSSQKKL